MPASAESAVIVTFALTGGDFNADGNLDLAMASAFDSTVSILLGNGDGTFLPRSTYATGRYPVCVAAADLDGDGAPDLAVANLGSNTVSVLAGNGDGTFRAKADFAAGAGPRSVAIADLNGDTRPDLAVANSSSRSVSVLPGDGDGTFGAPTGFAAGGDPSSVAVADLDGDGHSDLAVANWNYLDADWSPVIHDYISTISVLRGDGLGTFGPKHDVTTGGFPLAVGVVDFNRDGWPDLVSAGGSSPVAVLLGTGDGAFGEVSGSTTCGQGGFGGHSSLKAADLNADGMLDVAVPDLFSRRLSILLGYGDGTFAPSICTATVGLPHDVVIGDFDADGRPDVAIVQSDPDTITVMRNGSLGLPSAPLPRTSYSVGLWPNPSPGPTDIHWVVPRLVHPVEVSLFDLSGRRVRSLLSDPGLSPGAHSVHWNGLDDRGTRARAGVYLVRLRVGADVRVARLVVLP